MENRARGHGALHTCAQEAASVGVRRGARDRSRSGAGALVTDARGAASGTRGRSSGIGQRCERCGNIVLSVVKPANDGQRSTGKRNEEMIGAQSTRRMCFQMAPSLPRLSNFKRSAPRAFLRPVARASVAAPRHPLPLKARAPRCAVRP